MSRNPLEAVVQLTILRWISWLSGILLFWWLFLPYIDKWVMTALGAAR